MRNCLQNIQAIFFDYGGTLDSNGIPWKERFYKLYIKHGVNVPPTKFDKAFYAADDSLTMEGIVNLSLFETVKEQVKRVLKKLGITNCDLNEKISREFWEASTQQVEKNKPILKKLGSKYKIGIISNNYGNLYHICKELGLTPLLDVIVDSKQVGHAKPDPEIFLYALNTLKISPENAVMVGDSVPRDMKGAKSLGMPHILLAPENRKEITKPCCPDDLIITKLSELINIFNIS